jgi:hypothetical protein
VNLSEVSAKITLSEGASVYPPASQTVDLNGKSMIYVVTAENGLKQEYEVSATHPRKFTSIELSRPERLEGQADLTIYHIAGEGETLGTKLLESELNGLTVTKYYDNDTSSVVPFTDLTIAYKPSIKGPQAISVSVTEGTGENAVTHSSSFTGTVAFLTKIEQDVTSDAKKLYSIVDSGDVDITGLVVKGYFSDDTEQIIPNVSVTPGTLPTNPEAYKVYPVTVKVGNQTLSFEIGFYDPEAGLSVAIAGDERIEIYNLTYGTAPVGGFSFTLAWKEKKANDQYATPDMPGTSYDDRLDKLIVSISSTYNAGWYVDGTQVSSSSNKNVLVIDADDYTIGNHFLTVSADGGKITETIKFNVIK